MKSPLINITNAACLAASRQIIRDYNEVSFLKAHRKLDQFVENTQKRVSKILEQELLKSNMGNGFISQGKLVKQSNTNLYWVINPIDSAENFAHSFPFFGIAIALIEAPNLESQIEENIKIDFVKHAIKAAVFYDPLRDEFFFASDKEGAFLNEKKLTILSVQENLKKLVAGNGKLSNRNFGSSVMHMAYVAAKRLDGAESKLDDIANIYCGLLLLKEAKGIVKINNNTIEAGNC